MNRRDKNGLTEEEFLGSYVRGAYPTPSLTADIAVFSDGKLLLIKRGGHPYIGCWALPGGFANEGERIEESAARELFEETGVEGAELTELGMFTKPGRDPRGWVVTDAFCALLPEASTVIAGDDAREAVWFDVCNCYNIEDKMGELALSAGEVNIRYLYDKSSKTPVFFPKTEEALAFDHAEIILRAVEKNENRQ